MEIALTVKITNNQLPQTIYFYADIFMIGDICLKLFWRPSSNSWTIHQVIKLKEDA